MMKDEDQGKDYPQGLYRGSVPPARRPLKEVRVVQQPKSMGREGTERLHANTCSMAIPPAESLLGNVIHHPADATSTDRGGGGGRERHHIVQLDRWLRIALASFLYIPKRILINVITGQQRSPCTVSLAVQTER